jgi:hypothetical protein
MRKASKGGTGMEGFTRLRDPPDLTDERAIGIAQIHGRYF